MNSSKLDFHLNASNHLGQQCQFQPDCSVKHPNIYLIYFVSKALPTYFIALCLFTGWESTAVKSETEVKSSNHRFAGMQVFRISSSVLGNAMSNYVTHMRTACHKSCLCTFNVPTHKTQCSLRECP